MKIKFRDIIKKNLSLSFLKNQNIVSIIKRYYNENLNDISGEWDVYSQPELFKDIIKECYQIVKDSWDEYDYLISLGNNAAPLSYSLGLFYNKRVVFLDDEWGVTCFFQKIKPSNIVFSNKKVLLIVPYFESGLKVSRGIDILEDKGKNIHVDILTVVFFPEYVDKTIILNSKYEDTILHYLYMWDERVGRALDLFP
ncbi:MAG: hypothetical protein V5A64_03815 [Candidatus Thermoplasmatota archaeon]